MPRLRRSRVGTRRAGRVAPRRYGQDEGDTVVAREGARVLEPAPAWLLVALCLGTGAYCVLRMHTGPAAVRRTAGSEALMGFAMAAMAVPAVVAALPGWSWRVCSAVFGLLAVCAACAVRHDRHRLHHVVGSLAMVYMAAATADRGGGMEHVHGGAGIPALTGLLLLYFAAHALRTGARLVPVRAPGAGHAAGTAWAERPELVRACRLTMSIAMLAMLLGM